MARLKRIPKFSGIFSMLYPTIPVFSSVGSSLTEVLTTADYDRFVTQTKVGHVADYNMPLDYVVRLLSGVRGHIVSMPLHYMERAELIAPGLNLSINPLTGISYPPCVLIMPDDVYT